MRSEDFYKKQFGSWYDVLKGIVYSERFNDLLDKFIIDMTINQHAPSRNGALFAPFRSCPFDKLKVVIIGGETQHGDMSGLALAESDLSTNFNYRQAAIWKSLEKEYYDGLLLNPDLSMISWANQGVLMLNNSFTFKEGSEEICRELSLPFMKAIISRISKYMPDTLFVIWGREADGIYGDLLTGHYFKDYIFVEEPQRGVHWDFSFKEINNCLKTKIKF